MKDKTDSSNCESIKPIEVGDQEETIMNKEDFRTGLGQTTTGAIHIEERKCMDKIIEVGQGMI